MTRMISEKVFPVVNPAACCTLEPELHPHATHAVADGFVVVAPLLVATHMLRTLRKCG